MANHELTYTPLESGITEIRDAGGQLLGARGISRTVELPPMDPDSAFGEWGDTPGIIGHNIDTFIDEGEDK